MTKPKKCQKESKPNPTVKQLEALVVKLYLQTKEQQAKTEEVSAIINDLSREKARAVDLEMMVAALLQLLPDKVEHLELGQETAKAKPIIVKIHPDTVTTLKSKWAGYCAQYHK